MTRVQHCPITQSTTTQACHNASQTLLDDESIILMALRGDDDVFALLDELAGGGNAESNDSQSSSAAVDAETSRSTTTAITLPHTLLGAHQLNPPSNPHVEILRHRCHEKFKSSFYDSFRSCVPPPTTVAKTQASSSPTPTVNARRNQYIRSTLLFPIWNDMPPHSIWERYQFSLKTLEAECVREIQGATASGEGRLDPPWCQVTSQQQLLHQLLCPTVHQIYDWILHGKSNGIVWEPLLPVPSICSESVAEESSTMQHINQKYRKGSSELLQEEIKFQFRRTFKRYVGGGKRGKDGKVEPVSLDKILSTLKRFEDDVNNTASNDDSQKSKDEKHKKSKSKHEPHGFNMEETVLETLFESQPFQNMMQKLHKKMHFLFEDCYSSFITELKKCSNQLKLQNQNQTRRHGGGKKRKRSNNKHNNGIPKLSYVESEDQDSRDRQSQVAFGGISLRINDYHMGKLKSLYERTILSVSGDLEEYHQYFPQTLFTILLRYDALEGAGLQSAIPPSVFHFLHKRFQCSWECFASPFNCWLERRQGSGDIVGGGRFGCAFGDTDAWFGGAGSFFGMDFVSMANEQGGGCFQANPPFASNFMESMCNSMNKTLSQKDEDDGNSGVPLMFVIFVPAWRESSGWKALTESPHLSKHVVLLQKEDPHYYSEGTQHRRRSADSSDGNQKAASNVRKVMVGKEGTHRIASFDTGVFFFQNNAAKAKWDLTDEVENRLKEAFAMSSSEGGFKETSTSRTKKKHKQNTEQKHTATKDSSGKEKSKSTPTTMHNTKKVQKAKERGSALKQTSKKAKLITGGNDEMDILAGILGSTKKPATKSSNPKQSTGNATSKKHKEKKRVSRAT